MSFWDILWFIVISYVFIAYLMLMFHIFADVFRDQGLSGFGKAGWIAFLIVLPFLAALIYLIARGAGMAARQRAHVAEQVAAQDAYIRKVAGGSAAQVAEAKSLLDAGTIDHAEFEALKRKALA
jgi:hypothetical protein